MALGFYITGKGFTQEKCAGIEINEPMVTRVHNQIDA
jgi:hypothetical protein